jgi:DNA polymerase
MRAELLVLADELKRLRSEGVKTVTVAEESLVGLREAVARRQARPTPVVGDAAGPAAAPAIANPAAPAPVVAAKAAPVPAPSALPPVVVLPSGDKAARWNHLRDLALNHEVCRAHVRPGCKGVLGVGSLDAKIMFVGEAPGAEEELQGEPFVGPAGELLTKMIRGMGLARGDVYIGNIMNWRPELPVGPGGRQIGNRPPTPAEMAFCLPFLRAQIDIVNPELLVALGATAAAGLLGHGTFRALGEVRGRWHAFQGKPVMVTYHPSYLLRNGSIRAKRAVWEDLLLVMERAGIPVSEKQRGYFLQP